MASRPIVLPYSMPLAAHPCKCGNVRQMPGTENPSVHQPSAGGSGVCYTAVNGSKFIWAISSGRVPAHQFFADWQVILHEGGV